PVAAPAAAATTSSTASVARVAFTGGTFLRWLCLADAIFFWRSAVMVFMRDGVFGHRVLREALCVLDVFTWLTAAAATSATASTSAPTAAFAFTTLAFTTFTFTTFAFGAIDPLFDFDGDFGFLEMLVDLNGFLFHLFDRRQLRLLGGEVACGFRRVHL